MDGYTLVDTALKIGLGALISGIATYLTTKLNADKEKEKFILEHRIKTIELASEKIEEYFDAWTSFSGLIGGRSRLRSEGKIKTPSFSDEEMEQIRKRDKILIDAHEAKSYAISRFRLLGADDVVEAISESSRPVYDFRNLIIFERKVPTFEEFEEIRKKMNNIRREVQNKTSQYYKNLCS